MRKKMQKRSQRVEKRNNKGATLVTVLVGVGFLLILASITLAVSAANLHMKQIEQTMKDNFYADEQILDDVYNGIGKVTTECLSRAYADVLSQVSGTDGGAVFTTQDAAYRVFSQRFMAGLTSVMPVCSSADGDAASYSGLLNRLNSYITKDAAMAEVLGFSRTEILDENDAPMASYLAGGLPCKYVFRDVEVRYKMVNGDAAAGYTETGYEAVLTTDIEIEIPYINFFRDSSAILDYALIGNKGVYFQAGGKGENRKVEGNVYAGTDTSESPENKSKFRDVNVYGGLNIYNCSVEFDSNYLISKGDVNVRNANVTIGNTASLADTRLWAESLRTVENANKNAPVEESVLTVNGNLYLANDLELNARQSRITLNGAYYGYSNGSFGYGDSLENQEQQNLKESYQDAKAAHAQSSAIIVNGNKSQLDLSGLDTLVVAGVAYVDLRSQAYAGEAINNNGGNSLGKIEEIATGESLALKSNQYMYLAPTSCLTTSNPVKTAEAPTQVWAEGYVWFGTSKGYVNPTEPVIARQVTNRTTGEVYTYYYLNFLNNKREEYANLVLNMIDPVNGLSDMNPEIYTKFNYAQYDEIELAQIWEAKQTIMTRTLSDNVKPVITFADDTTASIYTRGAITKVGADTLASQLPADDSALSVDYVTKMGHILVKHYQYLYAELDPKEEFPLAPTTDAPNVILDPLPAITSVDAGAPVSKYVDFTGMVNGADSPDYKCGYKTHVYHGDFTLHDSNFKGVIICDGNVTIAGGSNVEGLVIASGRIYVEGGGSIVANRSIVQAILDEEATEEAKKESATERNMKYASTYLKEFRRADEDYTGKDYSDRISSTDYTDYISYRNWRKGEAN